MQSHLKALLQKRPTSKVCGCWQNPFLCALLERASSPLCWLEAAQGSLPCWPLHTAACYIQSFKPRRQGRELTHKINITIICNPTMEVTPHHTCHANYPTTFANAWQITRVQPRLRQELGGWVLHKGMNTWRQETLGSFLEISLPQKDSWADSWSRKSWSQSTCEKSRRLWRRQDKKTNQKKGNKRINVILFLKVLSWRKRTKMHFKQWKEIRQLI